MSDYDWLPELTDHDLATLAEALQAWESKDLATEIMGYVIDWFLARSGREASPERATEIEQLEREKAVRKERSVVLRAKLLTLRDRRRVEDATIRQTDPS
jgi:hypothetical protein